MEWWTEVRLALEAFLDQHGLLAAFAILLIEEAGVPIPIPGDFLMLLLGVQASQGKVPLWQAIVAMQLATMLGATFLYGIARWGGRPLVYRYGRFMRLSPERLDHAEQWLLKHGTRAVFLGRLVPGLRIVTAIACGVFRIPVWVFVPAMSLGALLYILVYTALGYLLGPPALALLERIHLPVGLLGLLIPLVLLLVWTFRARRGLSLALHPATLEVAHDQRLRAGAAAGALATVASTLLMNVVLNLAGNVAFQAPGILLEQTAIRLAIALARDVAPVLVFIAAPAFIAVGILWGALYGKWGERTIGTTHDWVNGTLFALLPLAVSLLVVMPVLGLGFLGLGVAGPVVAVGEALRHVAYGVMLGLLYPVLLVRRVARVQVAVTAEPPRRHTPRSAVFRSSGSRKDGRHSRLPRAGQPVLRPGGREHRRPPRPPAPGP